MSKKMIEARKLLNYAQSSSELVATIALLVAPFILMQTESMRNWEIGGVTKYFVILVSVFGFAAIIDMIVGYFRRILKKE